MLVLGCIGVAVWKMNQLAAADKASKAAGTRLATGDVEEVQLSYNRASDAGINADNDDANAVELTEVKLDAFDLPSAPDPVSDAPETPQGQCMALPLVFVTDLEDPIADESGALSGRTRVQSMHDLR